MSDTKVFRLWSEDEMAWLKTNYGPKGGRACGEHLGRTEMAVRRQANKLGLHVAYKYRAANCRIAATYTKSPEYEAAFKLADRQEGATRREMFPAETSEDCERHSTAISRRIRLGRMHRRYGVVNDAVEVRYFNVIEHADAWSMHTSRSEASAVMLAARKLVKRERTDFERARDREYKAKKRAERPRVLTTKLGANNKPQFQSPLKLKDKEQRVAVVAEIDYSRAKVTVIPAPPPRFAADPSTRVPGGFANQGIGRYLDEVAS